METTQRIREIKSRLVTLNEFAGKLNQEIKHERANNYFLGPVRSNLREAELLLAHWAREAPTPANASMFLDFADFDLGQAAMRLNYTQELASKYGEGIQVIAG